MAAGGLGVTLVPGLGMNVLAMPAIRMLSVSARVSRLVSAVLPAGNEAPSAAQLLVSAIKQHIASRHRHS